MGVGTTDGFTCSLGFLDTSARCSRFWDAMLHIGTTAGGGLTCLKWFFHQSPGLSSGSVKVCSILFPYICIHGCNEHWAGVSCPYGTSGDVEGTLFLIPAA